MAVLVTAIHAFVVAEEGVDARDEREHDGEGTGSDRLPPKPDSNALGATIHDFGARAEESRGCSHSRA